MNLINKLGLERSGNLLVSFPLICQVLFVLLLSVPLLNLQSNIASLSQSSELISKTISLISHTMNMGYVAKLNGAGPNDEAMRREAMAGERVRSQLSEIKQAAGADKNRLELVADLAQGAEELINTLAVTREEYKLGVRRWRKLNSRYDKSIRGSIAYLLNSADKMVATEEVKKREIEEKTQDDWKALNSFLITALVLSTILAFALAAVYVRAILMPLKHLSANCQRILRKEDLLPVLTTSEEFSKLDELLHVITNATLEEQEKEKAMVDNTNDLICSLNNQMEFLRANKSTMNFFGIEPEKIVGKSVFDFIATEDRKVTEESLKLAIAQEDTQSFEFKIKASGNDSEQQYIHTRWSCLYSKQSQELFAVVHDIDEEKVIEGLKQDFVDMVSHDLRSPLSSMHVALDMVASGAYGEVSIEAQKELEGARKNLYRLLEFVNDLLDFQKLKHGKMELECDNASVDSLVQSAADLVRPALEAKDLQLEVHGDDVLLFADAKKINQVLTNLLANAIHHTPQGGQIAVDWKATDDHVDISVSDTGPGIEEKDRKRIFEAFEQTPEAVSKGEGTGLGLAICKLICDAHNGSISVESVVGEGSRFILRIPLRQA